MPVHVLNAIIGAYQVPQTFAAAMAEYAHWQCRDEELGLILDTTGLGYGDTALDMAAGVRAAMLRDLVEKDMPVTTIEDLHSRFGLYRENENHDERIEEALFRDLTAIVGTRHLSVGDAEAAQTSIHDHNGQIAAALDADPSRSDRDVARACLCSPTTVGKLRRAMGLSGKVRSVQRGGQTFQMRFAFDIDGGRERCR